MTPFMVELRAVIESVVHEVLAKQKPPPADEHITVTEYARRWSISTSTVRQAISEKRLDHVRIGRSVRIAANARIDRRRTDRDMINARAMVRMLGLVPKGSTRAQLHAIAVEYAKREER